MYMYVISRIRDDFESENPVGLDEAVYGMFIYDIKFRGEFPVA